MFVLWLIAGVGICIGAYYLISNADGCFLTGLGFFLMLFGILVVISSAYILYNG